LNEFFGKSGRRGVFRQEACNYDEKVRRLAGERMDGERLYHENVGVQEAFRERKGRRKFRDTELYRRVLGAAMRMFEVAEKRPSEGRRFHMLAFWLSSS